MRCPRCRTGLVPEKGGRALFHRCVGCRGLAVNVAVLRQFAPKERVRAIWVNLDRGRPGDACPSCTAPLVVTSVTCGDRPVELDACRTCQLLWFDADELAAFSPDRLTPPGPVRDLPPRAAEALALAKIEWRREQDEAVDDADLAVGLIAAVFGLIR